MFYSENAVDLGKAARKRWASAVDAALSKRWHQLRFWGERGNKRNKEKSAYRYAANANSTASVGLRAPTRWAGMGQERANEFITAEGSKPAAKSISDTAIAHSICVKRTE